MDKLKYVKLENPDGSYSESIPLSVDGEFIDINGKNLIEKLNEKADQDFVDDSINSLEAQISGIASGSPAGTYSTVEELILADPNHNKIYIVTSNGHWYYYNNEWQDGGIYQATSADSIQTLDGESVQEKINKTVYKEDVINNLNSEEIDIPLSAKQGNNLNKSKIEVFNTVALMKNANLKNGMVVQTLGYYEPNDGGAGTYQIVDDSILVDDGGSIHELDNGLFAKLIIKNNIINIRQLGARSQDKNNNKYDIASYLAKYINILDTTPNRYKLYIPSGVWYTSPFNFNRLKGFEVYGDKGFCLSKVDGTFITSLNNNQNYIFQIGSNTNYTQNWSLKNIIFSTADCIYNSTTNSFDIDYSNIKTIQNQCLNIIYSSFGNTDNLFFKNIKGQAMKICSSWEIYFNILNFRDINALNTSVFCFDTADTTLQETANITACDFSKIMFEKILGDLIEFKNHCKVGNCHIGTINFEDYKYNSNYTTFTNSESIATFDNSNPIHNAILSLSENSTTVNTLIIDNIQLNNFSCWYYTKNEVNYCHDTICKVDGSSSMVGIIIGNIDCIGMNKNAYILKSNNIVFQKSIFTVNNINNITEFDFIFDVDNFTYINCNSRIKGIKSSLIYHLSNLATPSYKLINNRATVNASLKYDKDSLNELSLVAKQTENVSIVWVSSSKNLVIRAKIPENQVATLAIAGDNYQVITLEGTGEYESYEFTLGSSFKIGDKLNINYKTGETVPDYCYIDYIIN